MSLFNTSKRGHKVISKFLLIALLMATNIFGFNISAQQKNEERVEIMPKELLDNVIKARMMLTKDVFHWSDATDLMVWSALVQSDSLAIVGYQPEEFDPNEHAFEVRDIQSEEWESARIKIKDKINSWAEANLTIKEGRNEQIVAEKLPMVPYMIVKLSDLTLISELREMPGFANIEVGTYEFGVGYKIGEDHCDGEGDATAPAEMIPYDNDGLASTPPYMVSFHHESNNIIEAWGTAANEADNIKIALMDSGIETANPQFAPGVWVSEGSSGRAPLTMKGFHSEDFGASALGYDLTQATTYGPSLADLLLAYENSGYAIFDGVRDDCGHGTSMSSVLAGPHTTNGRMGGVAPKADLVSYRVTNDVLLDELEEKIGIYLGMLDVANDPEVKVISMSLGKLFYSNWIGDAIKINLSQGKLLFCAAGTKSLDIFGDVVDFLETIAIDTDIDVADNLLDQAINSLQDLLTIEQDALKIVVFPASMRETFAVTGRKDGSIELCHDCLGGDRVDLAPIMERVVNGEDTFPPAYAMDSNGNWMRHSGGSSCATATAAGIAALIWGERPNASAGTIINSMLMASDGNTNGTLTHHPYLGLGMVDADAAIKALPVQAIGNINNPYDVNMNITKIELPPGIGDGVLNFWTEWAITLNGQQHYAKVKNGGLGGAMMHTGHPFWYLKDNDHGSKGGLMRIPLGLIPNTGPWEVYVNYEIHEDDDKGFGLDVSGLDDHDDYVTSGFEIINLMTGVFSSSFEVELEGGPKMVFHYDLDIRETSLFNPCLATERTCEGSLATFTAEPEGATNYTFFHDVNGNNKQDFDEPDLQSGTSRIFNQKVGSYQQPGGPTTLPAGEYIGVKVSGSGYVEYASASIQTVPLPTVSAYPHPLAFNSYTFEINDVDACYQSCTYQWYFGDGTTSYPLDQGLGYYVDNQPITMGYMDNMVHNYQNNATEATLLIFCGGSQIASLTAEVDPYLENPPVCYFDLYPEDYTLWTPSSYGQKKLSVKVRGDWEGLSDYVQFTYNWGDGTSDTYNGPGQREHFYPGNGTYNVVITMTDLLNLNFCSITRNHTVTFSPPTYSGPKGGPILVSDVISFSDNVYVLNGGISTTSGGIKTFYLGGGAPEVGDLDAQKSGETLISNPEYNLFPNPCPGFVNIQQSRNDYQLSWVEVINVQGQLIQRHENLEANEIKLEQLPEGILFIRMASLNENSGELELETRRILSSK